VQGRFASALVRSGTATLTSIGREALRIVLPSWCVVCDGELPWRDREASCCGPCWAALPRIEFPQCRSCAAPSPVADAQDYVCFDCLRDPLPLERCAAWGEYRDGLERLLRAFKFQRHDFLAEPLAALLEPFVEDAGGFDAIVPVPMQRASERKRGYNQADLLARALGRRIGVPCKGLLLRRGGGARQSSLPKRERAENVRRAFAADSRSEGLRLLIVDDICTTGETLRACATALRAAGAASVSAVTVAKAT
jgi:ComF family protein